MKRRGKVNIDTADYLYNNANDIIREVNNNKSYLSNNLNSEDINHIIIGRWYYGLFLIAKDYLVNNINYIAKCKNKNNCFWNIKKNCRARCLVHKNPYKSNNVFIKKGGNKNSKYIFWIWEETANEIKTLSNKIRNRFLQSSIELIKLREKYEYYGSNCNIGILNKAQNYLNKIKEVYKNEKII